jgi:hypothetical protein
MTWSSSGDYTRAGLDITFRPDVTEHNFVDGKKSANPRIR